ncbi:hypothetical protein ACWATR_04470 [Nostoc sp. UIC 10890]
MMLKEPEGRGREKLFSCGSTERSLHFLLFSAFVTNIVRKEA